MNSFHRAQSLSDVGGNILVGADAGMEVKDFLHQFQLEGSATMLSQPPVPLSGKVQNGRVLDAYLQALAVYLSAQLNVDPPSWTQPAIQIPEPWFASPGAAIRNYLLISSPGPFRSRNLFIDEDSLRVL